MGQHMISNESGVERFPPCSPEGSGRVGTPGSKHEAEARATPEQLQAGPFVQIDIADPGCAAQPDQDASRRVIPLVGSAGPQTPLGAPPMPEHVEGRPVVLHLPDIAKLAMPMPAGDLVFSQQAAGIPWEEESGPRATNAESGQSSWAGSTADAQIVSTVPESDTNSTRG